MKKKSPFNLSAQHQWNIISKLTVFLFALLFSSGLFAQTFTKTIERSFEAKKEVAFRQNRGPLLVKKSNDGKVSFKSEIRIDAKLKADAERFFEKVEVDVSEFGDELEIVVGFDQIRRWNQNIKNITVTFKDGTKIKGLSDFKMQSILYLPETQLLQLDSRFDDVKIEEAVVVNALKAKLHSADLEAHHLGANLDLDMSFGKARLKNVAGDVHLKLHNGKVRFGDAQTVELNGRFSEIEMGTVATLRSDSHEGRIEVATILGETDIKARFSDYIIQNAKTVEIVSHEGHFEIQKATDLDLNTRFTDYEIGDIQSLKSDSHEGRIEVGAVANKVEIASQFTDYKFKNIGEMKVTAHNGNIILADAKKVVANSRFTDFGIEKVGNLEVEQAHEGSYELGEVDHIEAKVSFTDFGIEQLNESFVLDAHEGDTEIVSVSDNLKKIDLKGRFYEVEVDLPSTFTYHLHTDLYFGNINYPSGLEIVKLIEKDNRKQYYLRTKNAVESSARISVEGHEGKLKIR